MTEEENILIDKIVMDSSTSKYTEEQRKDLVEQCWNMLEPEVKEAYLKNIQNVGNKNLNGVSDFTRSMHRLQNSFSPDQKEEALENFKYLDKCNHSMEESLFSENLKDEINKSKILGKINGLAQSMQTQLSTLTSEPIMDDEKKELEAVVANLLEGFVTNKSSLTFTRSVDKQKIKIDKNSSSIHPSLAIAIGKYAKENIETLKSFSASEIKAIAGKLKAACQNINLDPKMPNSNKSYLIPLEDSFQKGVDLNMELSKLQSRKILPKLKDRVNSFDSTTTASQSPTSKESSSRGFFR